jgi:hypothetical protein
LQGMPRVGQIHIDLPSTADLYVVAETTATAPPMRWHTRRRIKRAQ